MLRKKLLPFQAGGTSTRARELKNKNATFSQRSIAPASSEARARGRRARGSRGGTCYAEEGKGLKTNKK
jgi:hypothetical protein